jgi:hypothetical protein
VYVTRGYHALAVDFRIAFDDERYARYWEWLLDGFSEPSGECITYEVDDHEDGGVCLRRDGDSMLQGTDDAALASSFVQWLNPFAIATESAVVSHAGGVARDGFACVLPAHMESGKTTLTAGLVRAGFDYVSDEAVAFGVADGVIDPYPKPLTIDPGSQFLFPELEPPLPPGCEREEGAQWQVPPSAIRRDAVAGACRARWILFPSYQEGVKTRLQPLARAEALVELAKNTFRFRDQPRRALDLLSVVVREVECHRLSVGDLDDAVRVVSDLIERDR